MNDNELKLIEKLSEVVGSTTGDTVCEYTKNIKITCAVWIVFGLTLLVVAVFLIPIPNPEIQHHVQWDGSYYDEITTKSLTTWLWVIRSIVGVIGALMVANNVPDFISPKAVGISRLLTEIRG